MGGHQQEDRRAEHLRWSSLLHHAEYGAQRHLSTGRHAFGGPGDRKGGEREAKAISGPHQRRLGMEEQGARARAGQNVLSFVFSFCFFFLAGWGERDQGALARSAMPI